MKRRSFLASALAWLVAGLGLLWPRRGQARAPGGFTAPSAPAVPAALPYRTPGEPDEVYSRSLRLYKDAGLMFDEMHAHLCRTGHACLPCDDPEKLRVGFSTFDDSGAPEEAVLWQCSFLGFKTLASRLREHGESVVPKSFGTSKDKDAVAILLECFKSSEGKSRLAASYQSAGRERFAAKLGPLP